MDDLAPLEPSRDAARIWCVALGLSFEAFGALPLIGLRPGGVKAAIPSLVIGAIAMVAALPGITYRQRAIAMVVLGLLSDIVGLQGTGAGGLGWNLARLVPAITIGAALMFRARYRAYTGARIFLGLALASSLPFVIQVSLGLGGGVGPFDAGAIVALLAIAASFSGFMGAETTGAGPYLAHGVALAFAVELVTSALGAPRARTDVGGVVQVVIPALAFVGSSVLAALGLFQIAAWRFAADARRSISIAPRSRAEPGRVGGGLVDAGVEEKGAVRCPFPRQLGCASLFLRACTLAAASAACFSASSSAALSASISAFCLAAASAASFSLALPISSSSAFSSSLFALSIFFEILDPERLAAAVAPRLIMPEELLREGRRQVLVRQGVGHLGELAVGHLAQGVELIDQRLALADGAEVAVHLLGQRELRQRLVREVHDIGDLVAHRDERRDGRPDEGRDEPAHRVELRAEDRALQLARALGAEVELVERRLAIVLGDEEDGGGECVDQGIERLVHHRDLGEGGDHGHAQVDFLRVDLDPGVVERGEVLGQIRGDRIGLQAGEGDGVLLQHGGQGGVLGNDGYGHALTDGSGAAVFNHREKFFANAGCPSKKRQNDHELSPGDPQATSCGARRCAGSPDLARVPLLRET
ncbi:MAG: hypothetical protein U0359_38950 [Byssovorax sp.]